MFKWPWIEESLARINDRKAEKAEQDEPVYNMGSSDSITHGIRDEVSTTLITETF